MTRVSHPIYRIRPVQQEDERELSRLYAHLNTFNANPTQTQNVIADSLLSLASPDDFKSVTIVLEEVDEMGVNPSGALYASARLIKLESSPVMMYLQHEDGLKLTAYQEAAVELAGAIVAPSHRRLGFGSALTAVRALIARLFESELSCEWAFTEFLPPYQEGGVNPFWDHLVAHAIDIEALSLDLSKAVGRPINGSDEIADVLLRALDAPTRNRLIQIYFPPRIDALPLAVRHTIETINPLSRGAQINFQRCYTTIDKVGVFAVDGGSNYSAPVSRGALGDCVVPYTCRTEMSAGLPFEERALIFSPQHLSPEGTLSTFQAVISPGYYSPTFAVLPKEAIQALEEEREHIYRAHVTEPKLAYYRLSALR
jgi:hypothetical protein